jgi:hypothetical protein
MTELQKSSNAAILAAMKAALTISRRGTLTLPAKLRQSLGLKADDQLIAGFPVLGPADFPGLYPP